MNLRRILAIIGILGMVATTAACGGGTKTSGDSDAYSIGVVHFASADPSSEGAITNYKTYAKKQGWKTTDIDPQGSLDKAISAIDSFVQKKVDLIVVGVFPSDSLTAGLRGAKAAGIPVISIAGGLADGVVANMDAANAVGQSVAEQLVKDMGGKGELLLLGYKSGLPCIGREEALNEHLKGTQIKVTRKEVPIPGQEEASNRFANAWLATHPAGSGSLAIWGCTDDFAVGSLSAARENKRTDVKIYAINGRPDMLKAVQSGDVRAINYLDVAAAGTVLAEKTPGFVKGGVDVKAAEFPIPTFLVTKETLAEFQTKYPSALN